MVLASCSIALFRLFTTASAWTFVLDPPVDGRQQVQDDPKRGNSGGDPKEVAHVTGGVAGIHGGIPLPHGSAGR